MRAATAGHVGVYRATGGRLGGRVVGMPALLLTTTGRRSGKPRTTPLTYLEDGDTVVLAASNGGNPWFPAWWHNLRADPRAGVQIGGRRMQMRAREATAAERERLWPRFLRSYKGYAEYEGKTSRRIPVVILEADPARPG